MRKTRCSTFVAELAHEHAETHVTSLLQTSNLCFIPCNLDFASSISCGRYPCGYEELPNGPRATTCPAHPSSDTLFWFRVYAEISILATHHLLFSDRWHHEWSTRAAADGSVPILLINSLNIRYAGPGLPQLGSSYSICSPASHICRVHSSAPLTLVLWYHVTVIPYVHSCCSNAAKTWSGRAVACCYGILSLLHRLDSC